MNAETAILDCCKVMHFALKKGQLQDLKNLCDSRHTPGMFAKGHDKIEVGTLFPTVIGKVCVSKNINYIAGIYSWN